MKAVKIVGLAYAALLTVIVWFGISIHFDPHGVSIGTDTHYCSIELNHDEHGGGLDFWCEVAR